MKAEWSILLAQWINGARTREASLRLLFLAWYSCSEPAHLSGLEEVAPKKGSIDELFGFLGGEEAQDSEVLFVVSVMAEVAPWCLGDVARWEKVAGIFRGRLSGYTPPQDNFLDRGSYGEYFAHQARVHSGDAT